MTRTLTLIRHGATASSASGAYTGRADHDLTDRGVAQCVAWREPLLKLQPLASFSSPLRRARDSAAAAGLEPTILEQLTEWDLGELEGLQAQKYREAHPEWNLYTDGPPRGSGESVSCVTERAHDALDSLTQPSADAPAKVAFSHGQFIRVLTAVALNAPLEVVSRFALGPGRAAHLIERQPGRLSLAGWNVAPRDLFTELT